MRASEKYLHGFIKGSFRINIYDARTYGDLRELEALINCDLLNDSIIQGDAEYKYNKLIKELGII